MTEWTEELSLELVGLVEREPVLWDKRHPDYKDPGASLLAWRRVQADMSSHLPASELERRKEEMFARYAKLEAKVRASHKARLHHSPYEPTDPPELFVPSWFAFQAIASFLAPRRPPLHQEERGGGMSTAGKRVTFQEQFRLFSKFGDRDSDGKHIKLSQSDKWMRQAKVIDGKRVTSTDTGICFKKLKQPKLGEGDYNLFLEDLARSKGFDVSELKLKMTDCGPPGFTSAVSNAKTTGAVERLTDPTKYTGSHKERFDETGKGKGLAGRRDDVDSSGYVSGYANKNTYDKNHPIN